jgi:hypothetical protein
MIQPRLGNDWGYRQSTTIDGILSAIDSKRASLRKGQLSPIIIRASRMSYTLIINNFITTNRIKKPLVI